MNPLCRVYLGAGGGMHAETLSYVMAESNRCGRIIPGKLGPQKQQRDP